MSYRYISLWFAGFILATGVIFQSGLSGPFVLDDVAKIRDNPTIRNSNFQFIDFFSSYEVHKTNFRNDPSRPLTYMVYWALWQTGAGSPTYFHVASLILHSLNAVLFGLILLELLGSSATALAVAASALFVLLPLNAGTVLYAFSLSDILVTFFTFLLALFVLKKVCRTERISFFTLCVSTAFMILALMSKQSAVVIPAMILVLISKYKRLHVTLFAVSGAYVILRLRLYGQIGDIEAVELYPALTYFSAQGAAFWHYIWLILVPQNLCLDHAIFPRSYPTVLQVTGWLAWLVSFIWAAKEIAKNTRSKHIMAIGWLWFVLPLIPTGSFLPTTDIFVERRAYWASAGFIMFASAGVLPIWSRGSTRAKASLATVAVLLLSLAAVITYKRSQVFASDISLYSEIARIYPGDVRSNTNLATAYLQAGQAAGARPILENILERYPNEPNTLVNLAALHQAPEFGMVDLERARKLLDRVLAIEPENLKALLNSGQLHLSKNELEEARHQFLKALELSPCLAPSNFGLAQISEMKNDETEAIRFYQLALKCDPSFQPARHALEKRAHK